LAVVALVELVALLALLVALVQAQFLLQSHQLVVVVVVEAHQVAKAV
jgi:hypothetical protein